MGIITYRIRGDALLKGRPGGNLCLTNSFVLLKGNGAGTRRHLQGRPKAKALGYQPPFYMGDLRRG